MVHGRSKIDYFCGQAWIELPMAMGFNPCICTTSLYFVLRETYSLSSKVNKEELSEIKHRIYVLNSFRNVQSSQCN
jgi:hypothetical protein